MMITHWQLIKSSIIGVEAACGVVLGGGCMMTVDIFLFDSQFTTEHKFNLSGSVTHSNQLCVLVATLTGTYEPANNKIVTQDVSRR
jgi:hypothetical protein